MRTAAFFRAGPRHGSVECLLCPRRCTIPDGASGFCGVRRNAGGVLETLSYGRPAAVNIDPIEKKPLAEFMPGTRTLSFGTLGCNLSCPWCQNAELSCGRYPEPPPPESATPEGLVAAARERGCPSISYTYNEPTVFYEFMFDTAQAARREGLANILVSNAFIASEPAKQLAGVIDAANFDMKGFDRELYRRDCGGDLAAVLETIELFFRRGVHVEVTNLVIPGVNDGMEQTDRWLDWVEAHLNREVPLHFSAYFPCFKSQRPATPAALLYRIRDRAGERGFHHVYLGNIR